MQPLESRPLFLSRRFESKLHCSSFALVVFVDWTTNGLSGEKSGLPFERPSSRSVVWTAGL